MCYTHTHTHIYIYIYISICIYIYIYICCFIVTDAGPKACAKGHPRALFQIAEMLREGQGLPNDQETTTKETATTTYCYFYYS